MNYNDYKNIHQYSTPNNFNKGWMDVLCSYLCPPFTFYFIKMKVSPNTITMFMIIFGIVGSILLALPYYMCKLAAVVSFILWYTMDHSDGQVARITKQFSQFGVEMDYMAHLISHSLFIIAMWCSLVQMDYDIYISSISCMLILMSELILRNIVSFDYYINSKKSLVSALMSRKSPITVIFHQLSYFPNVIAIFSILVSIRMSVQFNLLLLWCIVVAFISLRSLRGYYGRLLRFYSE